MSTISSSLPNPKIKDSHKSTDQNSVINAVLRKKIAAVYVGRTDSSTSEADFNSYLEKRGLIDVVYRKIKTKQGASFKTAAFYDSCDVLCPEKLYDPEVWPYDAEV